MPKHGIYEATVVVNGLRLREYMPPGDEAADIRPGKQVRYIEAQPGQEFTIEVNSGILGNHKNNDKACYLEIDGKATDSRFLYLGSGQSLNLVLSTFRYSVGGRFYEQPFLFQKLSTTDEKRQVKEMKQLVNGLGSIKVKIFDFYKTGSRPETSLPGQRGADTIPEKALKGQPIDLQTSYGKSRPSNMLTSVQGRRGPCLSTFEFKYRSRAALQMMDIIATDSESQPLEDQDPATLTHEELVQLVRERREKDEADARAQKQNPQIKAERKPIVDGRGRIRNRSTQDESDSDCQVIEVKKRKTSHTRPDGEADVEVTEIF